MPPERRSLLRDLSHGHAAVSYLELFLDLVYVFAITQLSHFLLEHLTPLGALQAVILFLAVWWAWIYTTWATNWLNPERGPVRFLIGGVMIGSLMMSSALPHAFERDGGLPFALAYCGIQILRTGFTAWAPVGGASPASPYNDTGLASGFCYEYHLVVNDNVGNATTTTNATQVLVDGGAPQGTISGTPTGPRAAEAARRRARASRAAAVSLSAWRTGCVGGSRKAAETPIGASDGHEVRAGRCAADCGAHPRMPRSVLTRCVR